MASFSGFAFSTVVATLLVASSTASALALKNLCFTMQSELERSQVLNSKGHNLSFAVKGNQCCANICLIMRSVTCLELCTPSTSVVSTTTAQLNVSQSQPVRKSSEASEAVSKITACQYTSETTNDFKEKNHGKKMIDKKKKIDGNKKKNGNKKRDGYEYFHVVTKSSEASEDVSILTGSQYTSETTNVSKENIGGKEKNNSNMQNVGNKKNSYSFNISVGRNKRLIRIFT